MKYIQHFLRKIAADYFGRAALLFRKRKGQIARPAAKVDKFIASLSVGISLAAALRQPKSSPMLARWLIKSYRPAIRENIFSMSQRSKFHRFESCQFIVP